MNISNKKAVMIQLKESILFEGCWTLKQFAWRDCEMLIHSLGSEQPGLHDPAWYRNLGLYDSEVTFSLYLYFVICFFS